MLKTIVISMLFVLPLEAAISERLIAIQNALQEAEDSRAATSVMVEHLKRLRDFTRERAASTEDHEGVLEATNSVLDYYMDFPPERVSNLLRVIVSFVPGSRAQEETADRIPGPPAGGENPSQVPGPPPVRGINARRIRKMDRFSTGPSYARDPNNCARHIRKSQRRERY